MSDDQYTRLFKYMQKEFRDVRSDIKRMDINIDRVYALLDADLKKRETDEQERLAMNRQLGRHEGWIKQISQKTTTKLVPEP